MKLVFVFSEDFANNWKKGEEVECKRLGETIAGDTILVDGVASFPVDELLKHGKFKDIKIQIEADKTALKSKASELLQELNESGLPYEDFVEVQEYILNLFSSIN